VIVNRKVIDYSFQYPVGLRRGASFFDRIGFDIPIGPWFTCPYEKMDYDREDAGFHSYTVEEGDGEIRIKLKK
jgi:hypothetical protein